MSRIKQALIQFCLNFIIVSFYYFNCISHFMQQDITQKLSDRHNFRASIAQDNLPIQEQTIDPQYSQNGSVNSPNTYISDYDYSKTNILQNIIEVPLHKSPQSGFLGANILNKMKNLNQKLEQYQELYKREVQKWQNTSLLQTGENDRLPIENPKDERLRQKIKLEQDICKISKQLNDISTEYQENQKHFKERLAEKELQILCLKGTVQELQIQLKAARSNNQRTFELKDKGQNIKSQRQTPIIRYSQPIQQLPSQNNFQVNFDQTPKYQIQNQLQQNRLRKFSIGDIKNYNQLIKEIRKQIEDNHQKYGLLTPDIFATIFQEFDKFSFNEGLLLEISTNLLKYMREGLNRSSQKQDNGNFIIEFGKKIRRVWDEAFFQNKNTLRVMSYLIKGINQKDCYLNLSFDLSQKQTMAVAAKTRQLCKFDLRAFLFLTNYFYLSCLNLERQGKSLSDIESIFVGAVNIVSKAYPPAPQLRQSIELNKHKSYKKDGDIKRDAIDLMKQNKKKEALTKFILKQAEQASNNYITFVELVQQTCKQKGSHFKIGVKIKDQSHKRAIDRVTEKMIGKSFKKYSVQEYCGEHCNPQSMSQFIKEQERLYEIQMEQIYSKITEPIEFKVSDMLRAKCLFRTVLDINSCAQQLMTKVVNSNSNCEVVQLDNRLSGQVKTSDIVLKILMNNTIAQLQLPIDFDVAENQFSHKIYEITRSKFFSPFSMLRIINEQIKGDYLKIIIDCFKVNNANSSHEEQIKSYNSSSVEKQFKEISFKMLQKSLNSFLKMLDFTINNQHEEKKPLVLEKILTQFNEIKQESKKENSHNIKGLMQQYKNNGQYLKQIKKFDHSLTEFQKYFKSIENQQAIVNNKQIQKDKLLKLLREKSETHNSIGQIYKDQGKYSNSLNQYIKSLQVEEIIFGRHAMDRAIIHNNIGLLYRKQGNYNLALEQYAKSLKIQERVVGQYAIQCALTHNNIGDVYKQQGNFQMALQQLLKSLDIHYKKQENQTIECAKVHNSIGNVYSLQGNYQKALKQYIKCLQIQQKLLGRQAINCAFSHNNIAGIYCSIGDYEKSIKEYKRSLQIKERVLGQDSLDCAIVHNNIGDVFQKRGNKEMALEQYKICLSIQKTVLGKQAIDCASTHMNIGGVYRQQENFQLALKQLMISLQITENILGKEDIKCASVHSCIGSMYRMQGCYEIAIQQYMKCLQIQDKILGKQAIDCASTHNNIGNVYRVQGKFQIALYQMGKCLQIQQNILGKQAIDCASTHINISSVLLQMGNFDKAIEQLIICLQIKQIIFGGNSRECALVLSNIGDICQKKGQFQLANNFYTKCHQIQENIARKEDDYTDIKQKDNFVNQPIEMIPNRILYETVSFKRQINQDDIQFMAFNVVDYNEVQQYQV